jgi:hypothetical protein
MLLIFGTAFSMELPVTSSPPFPCNWHTLSPTPIPREGEGRGKRARSQEQVHGMHTYAAYSTQSHTHTTITWPHFNTQGSSLRPLEVRLALVSGQLSNCTIWAPAPLETPEPVGNKPNLPNQPVVPVGAPAAHDSSCILLASDGDEAQRHKLQPTAGDDVPAAQADCSHASTENGNQGGENQVGQNQGAETKHTLGGRGENSNQPCVGEACGRPDCDDIKPTSMHSTGFTSGICGVCDCDMYRCLRDPSNKVRAAP